MADLKENASQTAGPYVHIGCMPQTAGLKRRNMSALLGEVMVSDDTDAITLDIAVLDGDGVPIKDGLIEIWQAAPDGSYAPSKDFAHWGRQVTDMETGQARFTTVKPGAAKGQAPHILIWIAARGINLALTSRIYFPDEDNKLDPIFRAAEARAATLIAAQTKTGYAHTIHLQGPKETVFFDV